MARSRSAVGAAAILLVLLTGCTPATPSAMPTDSAAPVSAPSSTAAPTPTPTVSPSAAQVASDPSTWIVDYDQVAGVHVGDSIAALARAAGLPAVTDTVDCPPGYGTEGAVQNKLSTALLDADARGHAVDDPPLTVAVFGITPVPDAVVAASPSTLAGIRLGSTEAQLLTAYPDIRKTHSRYDDNVGYSTYAVGPVDGRYLVFQVGTSGSGARVVTTIASAPVDSVISYCD